MRVARLLAPAALIALAGLGFALRQTPSAPPPNAEQKRLEAYVGEWDAAVKMHMGPMGTLESKGVETNRLTCQGKWLETTFVGDMAGAPFEGRGLIGWDARKQQDVGVWVDSMGPAMQVMQGVYASDPATLTFAYDAQDFTGQDARARDVTTFEGDKRTMRMYMTPKGGAETLVMEIAYTRKAAGGAR